MIISRKHKFIFIHVPKVGGTSIKKGLRSFYDRKTELEKVPKGMRVSSAIARKHVAAFMLRQAIGGKQWNNYFKFGFVRNPWDWVVSIYHFIRINGRDPRQPEVLKMTFEQFVPWFIRQDSVEFKLLNGQHSYLMHRGKTLVNFIGKIEKFQEHFDIVCDRIGIAHQKLGRDNTTKRTAYRDYYSEKNRKIVAQFFKKDIQLFRYEF